jgi:diacylglycerol kinase family enzyme
MAHEHSMKEVTTDGAAPPVDVIINANARHLGDGSPLRRMLRDGAHRGGAACHETTSLAELERVALTIAARGSRAVVLAGGDGTHMAGVSALARACAGALPPVALAPGGTVCTVARNFGMRGPPGPYAQHLLAAACDGRARTERRATLRVRDDTGADAVGFIFGAGLVARFFELYDASPERGLGSAGLLAAKALFGSLIGSRAAQAMLSPAPCMLVVDGEPTPSRAWSLVLASAVRDVGLHVRATYRAGERLDRFHVVASALRPRALGLEAPRVLLGVPMRGGPRVDALASSLGVEFDAEGAYVLDGDSFRARRVRVDAGPVLDLILPPRP